MDLTALRFDEATDFASGLSLRYYARASDPDRFSWALGIVMSYLSAFLSCLYCIEVYLIVLAY